MDVNPAIKTRYFQIDTTDELVDFSLPFPNAECMLMFT